MSLRIIAGDLGGRRIKTPRGTATRPTREAVREAWFSSLSPRLPDSRVLDLFAGSGALGIEALSRGAAWVTFVEADQRVCDVLRSNVSTLGVEERCEVRRADAVRVAERLAREGVREWDIVLSDPPYGGDEAMQIVAAFGRFAYARILCVEHAPDTDLPGDPVWNRTYGDTALSFFVDPMEGVSA